MGVVYLVVFVSPNEVGIALFTSIHEELVYRRGALGDRLALVHMHHESGIVIGFEPTFTGGAKDTEI